MAKKKDEAEVVPEKKEDPGYTNEELHNESIESIAQGGESETPEKKTTTPQPPETKTETIPEKEEKIDQEALSEAVSEKAAQKIIERMTGTKDKKGETDEELIAPWKKEGRPPKDYEEIADWAVQKKAVLDARAQKQQEERQQTETKAQQEAAETYKKQYNATIDQHLDQLYELGKLPKIQFPPELKHISDKIKANEILTKEETEQYKRIPGVAQRMALFQAMLDWSQEIEKENITRQANNQPLLPYPTLKEVFYERYKDPSRQPPGANAPISFGQGTTQTQEEGSYTYADLKKPWEEVMGG